MTTNSQAAEFPTLDLDELDDAPRHRAVHLVAIERSELPGILAALLPGVVHACRARGHSHDAHEFIDSATGAAVRYVLTWSERGHVEASVAESGPPGLFDRIVAACTAWEQAGRPKPAELSRTAQ